MIREGYNSVNKRPRKEIRDKSSKERTIIEHEDIRVRHSKIEKNVRRIYSPMVKRT